MNFKKLSLFGLSLSQTNSESYLAILSENDGDRKIPIIVNPVVAQYLALKVQDLKTNKPFTYDLFKVFTDNLGADLYEIKIINIVEGIFYVKAILNNMVDEFEIEVSIGDAVALSMSYDCPIMCSEEVLSTTGIIIDSNGVLESSPTKYSVNNQNASIISVENLEKMLEKAIQSEEYEIASQLRDKINDIKKTSFPLD
jgi:bifunctional DNase/RNase